MDAPARFFGIMLKGNIEEIFDTCVFKYLVSSLMQPRTPYGNRKDWAGLKFQQNKPSGNLFCAIFMRNNFYRIDIPYVEI